MKDRGKMHVTDRGFSKEDQLIITCARDGLSDASLAVAASLLQQELDWDYILEAAILHGVAPLLHRSLDQVQASQEDVSMPASTMKTLQQLYTNNRQRNQRLYTTLGEVVKALQAESIEVLGLKDIVLARTVFSDIGLRPIGDVDLLIHQSDYDQFAMCVADLGFSPLPSPDCPYLLKYAWALHFRRPADEVWLDVQWGVLQLEWDIYGEGNFDLETDRMWRNAYRFKIADYEILAPRPENMLFHLCMHLEGHRYAELILFSDIVAFIHHYGEEIDWLYFFALGKKYGVEASLYYTLLFVEQLFQCPLPFTLNESDLSPDYFKADLFAPMFGNLTTLHGALDEIDRTAAPPLAVMEQFEQVVRHQAVCAMRGYEELDNLASMIDQLEAEIILFDSRGSTKAFPSRALPEFPEIYMFTLQQARPCVEQALATCGFTERTDSAYVKRGVYASVDPALSDIPVRVDLHARFLKGLDAVLDLQIASPAAQSKKEMALQALSGALHRQDVDSAAKMTLNLALLTPEEMVVYFAARIGQQEYERLFKLCDLIEFLRRYPGEIHWQAVAELAAAHDMAAAVHVGLLAVNPLLDHPLPPEAFSHFEPLDAPPRLLNWARYGPGSLERYTSFKALFYCIFSLASTEGLAAKLKYLLRISDRRHQRALGLTCVNHAARLGWQILTSPLRRKRRYTVQDFAYWTRPETPSDS